MPTSSLLRSLQADLSTHLVQFVPELTLAATIVLLLFLRLFSAFSRLHLGSFAIIATTIALAYAVLQSFGGTPGRIFTGLLEFDHWAIATRVIVLAATFLTLILSRFTGLPDAEDSVDFCVLLLGAALGLMLMCSANHLLMVFLAIEMASLPSYALTGFLKGRSTGSEAALKYAIYGAAASGIMLYGISLVTAITGSGDLPTVSRILFSQPLELAGVAGLLFIGIGLGYKLSAVPFHVWLPDTFEGAAAEVGAFLSVASKAAALALLARLLVKSPHADWSLGLLIFAAVTATFGNLLAYAQTNLKRLLGYSTIAHAGFLLAGVGTLSTAGLTATLVYLLAYLLANLGAFATIAAIRNATGREDVASLGGLMKHSPLLGVGFAICVLSLLGLPPLAGFSGKFLVFSAVWNASHGVFVVLMINTAIAAGYYLRLLRVMALDDATFEASAKIPTGLPAFTLLLALASVVFGVLWAPLLDWAKAAAESLH